MLENRAELQSLLCGGVLINGSNMSRAVHGGVAVTPRKLRGSWPFWTHKAPGPTAQRTSSKSTRPSRLESNFAKHLYSSSSDCSKFIFRSRFSTCGFATMFYERQGSHVSR